MFHIYGGKTEFQQWETGQLVTCPHMEVGDAVVFRAHGKAYAAKATQREVGVWADVPNYLLQEAGQIRVDLGWDANGHLDCRTYFEIAEQEKPEDYSCDCNIEHGSTIEGFQVGKGMHISEDGVLDAEVEPGAGGAKTWTDVAETPLRVTWDGDTEGREMISLQRMSFYKVSNDYITAEQADGFTGTVSGGSALGTADTFTTEGCYSSNTGTNIRDSEGTLYAISVPAGHETYSQGLYFLYMSAEAITQMGVSTEDALFTKSLSGSIITTCPEAYLPESVADKKILIANAVGETLDTPVSDMLSAIRAGKVVFVFFVEHAASAQIDVYVSCGLTEDGKVYFMSWDLSGSSCLNRIKLATASETDSGDVFNTTFIQVASGQYNTATYRVVLASSTSGSTKKFAIRVDDSGTLTATEVTS